MRRPAGRPHLGPGRHLPRRARGRASTWPSPTPTTTTLRAGAARRRAAGRGHRARRRHGRGHPGAPLLAPGPSRAGSGSMGWHGGQHDRTTRRRCWPRRPGLRYAAVALITDYDAGVDGQEPVTQEAVLRASSSSNVDRVRELLAAGGPARCPRLARALPPSVSRVPRRRAMSSHVSPGAVASLAAAAPAPAHRPGQPAARLLARSPRSAPRTVAVMRVQRRRRPTPPRRRCGTHAAGRGRRRRSSRRARRSAPTNTERPRAARGAACPTGVADARCRRATAFAHVGRGRRARRSPPPRAGRRRAGRRRAGRRRPAGLAVPRRRRRLPRASRATGSTSWPPSRRRRRRRGAVVGGRRAVVGRRRSERRSWLSPWTRWSTAPRGRWR